jgi:ATP-dependent DNA ligase
MLADYRGSRSENSLELSALPAAFAILTARERHPVREHAEAHSDKLFAAVCKLGLEGIVSKRRTSPYRAIESLDQGQKSKCSGGHSGEDAAFLATLGNVTCSPFPINRIALL